MGVILAPKMEPKIDPRSVRKRWTASYNDPKYVNLSYSQCIEMHDTATSIDRDRDMFTALKRKAGDILDTPTKISKRERRGKGEGKGAKQEGGGGGGG